MPNTTRLLLCWGLSPAHPHHQADWNCLWQYDMGMHMGYTRWGLHMTFDHGAVPPHPLQGLPSDASSAHPHRTRHTNPPVCAIQPDPAVMGGPSVMLASGEVLYADLVVSAERQEHVAEARHRAQRWTNTDRQCCVSRGHVHRSYASRSQALSICGDT